MEQPHMDAIDRRLLNLLQKKLPLVSRPFTVLGESLGIREEEVLERLNRLKHDGFIRRIGAVLESRQMGFVSTLAALQVPTEEIEHAASLINSYPEVTHNYLRSHQWNLWFTLIAPDAGRIDSILQEIRRQKNWPMMSLPTEKVYKIKAEFTL